MSVFRAYDIRGIYGDDLTDDLARNIGKAYAAYVGAGKIAVGRDCRLSSPSLHDALVEGLVSGGCEVVDIGMVPTPLLYFSIHCYSLDGGIMITGSHNPGNYNGFKMCKGTSTLFGDDIQEIKKIIDSGDYSSGGAFGSGSYSEKDVTGDYSSEVLGRISLARPLKVVLDAGNGMGGVISSELFSKLGCDIISLYCEPDGNFPNHHPDPTLDSELKDLVAKVVEEKADFGVAYDGDADRAGFVDNTGRILRGDQALILFSRGILKKNPGAKIITEVKCSQATTEDIEKNGGVAIMYRTGHSFIKKKIKEEGALLAGEMSGHFFFADGYYGFDDAVFASLRMAELVSENQSSLYELVETIPNYPSTPEIRVPCPDERKFEIVSQVTEKFKQSHDVITVDGARIQFDGGWGLVRASNTEPSLILRFEAENPERLESIRKEVEDELRKYPELAGNL